MRIPWKPLEKMCTAAVAAVWMAGAPCGAEETFTGVTLPGETAEPPAEEAPSSDSDAAAEPSEPTTSGEESEAEANQAPENSVGEEAGGEFTGVVLPAESNAQPVSPVIAPPVSGESADDSAGAQYGAGASRESNTSSDADSPPPPGADEPPRPDAGPTKHTFSKLTISPQVGYLFFPRAELEFQGMKATVDPRNGFAVKLHLDLGGDGFAFELSPFFAMEYGGIHADADGFGNLSSVDFSASAAGASLLGVGGELGVVYRFKIKRFYPHIGVGFRGSYLFGDQIEYGTEIYGRFPIGFTAYVGKHIALVLDLGLMVGATGVRTPPSLPEAFDSMPGDLRAGLEAADSQADFEAWYTDNQVELEQWMMDNQNNLPEGYSEEQMAQDYVAEQMSKSIRFGTGFGMDIMFGVRFP